MLEVYQRDSEVMLVSILTRSIEGRGAICRCTDAQAILAKSHLESWA